jgi:hypothetical protein
VLLTPRSLISLALRERIDMGRILVAFIVSLAAAWTSACGSSTQSVTGPSTVKCAVNASANPSSFSAAGGGGTLAVTTNRECQWTAAPSRDWIKLGSSSGQGDGTVSFTVGANADPAVRQGAISVGDQQVSIAQEAAPCAFTVSPTRDGVSSSGERRTVTVTASSALCAWTARSDVDWLVIVDGSQGTGTGQVTYEARPTTGPSRSGTLLVAGKVVTVVQGEGCTLTIAPTTQDVPASGASGTIAVTTGAGCPWTTQSNAPWITITSGQTGSGTGTVSFTVAASDGPARTGTLTVGGQVFTVSQAAGCTYSIDPASESIAAAGGAGGVNVHTTAGCGWNATSNASWISVASGGTGSGDGRVEFNVAGTTGPARSGTLTIAGRTFTVNQASGCTYTLSPTSQNVGDGGGTGTFTVTSTAGCGWTAVSNAAWLTVTSGASGSGNGTVGFHADPNPMGLPARTGTITVNGQAFTVNQSAGVACTYTLDPPSRDVSPAAGSSSFAVHAVATCPWTATSNVPWITLTRPSGAGEGAVEFTYAENPAGSPARTGTITVNGQTFTLNQAAGVPCTYSLSPSSVSVSWKAGTGSFTVTTPPGCTWTPVSSDPSWLTVTSVSGNTVNYSYTENLQGSPARRATIAVGDQVFTVDQDIRTDMEP